MELTQQTEYDEINFKNLSHKMKDKSSITKVLPVLFGFFIMGLVDLVGIATNYVKQDFALSDTLANMLPMTLFLWFVVLSVPTGIMMNKLGRKRTVVPEVLKTGNMFFWFLQE